MADRIQAQFREYHAKNPEVYRLFRRFAAELRAAGHERYSADAILHRIRWHYDISGPKDGSGFKINDNYSSRYPRMLVKDDPSFQGFFEFRRSGADDDDDDEGDPAAAEALDGFD